MSRFIESHTDLGCEDMDNDINSRPGIRPYRVVPSDESGRQLLRRYLDRRDKDLSRMKEALTREDYDLIRRIGHNLRGSGAAYDLVRISILGEQIELAAQNHAAHDLEETITLLEGFLASVSIGKSP